jgi:hypothetical protein
VVVAAGGAEVTVVAEVAEAAAEGVGSAQAASAKAVPLQH